MFNPVTPYRCLLPTVYLFMADIANRDLFVCSCRTWNCLDISLFYEEQRQSSSRSAWQACPKIDNSGPHWWERKSSLQCYASVQLPSSSNDMTPSNLWNRPVDAIRGRNTRLNSEEQQQRKFLTQFAQQFVNAVTAPPLVGCVVWSFLLCCCRPTPPACSCGGVRQPSFSREALPGVSST